MNQQDALFYSQFISIINLYMFLAGLLLIIRRHYSVYTATAICHAENNGIMQNNLNICTMSLKV